MFHLFVRRERLYFIYLVLSPKNGITGSLVPGSKMRLFHEKLCDNVNKDF